MLWPGCRKWTGQYIVAILVVSSTILAQHGLCLTSETMRLIKCSEISKTRLQNKVTRLLPQNCYGGGRETDHYVQCGPSRFASKLFFDSLSLSKPNKSDVRAQLPCQLYLKCDTDEEHEIVKCVEFFPSY